MNAKNETKAGPSLPSETKVYRLAPDVNADALTLAIRKHGFTAWLEEDGLHTTANASVINLMFGRSSWRVISNIWA